MCASANNYVDGLNINYPLIHYSFILYHMWSKHGENMSKYMFFRSGCVNFSGKVIGIIGIQNYINRSKFKQNALAYIIN